MRTYLLIIFLIAINTKINSQTDSISIFFAINKHEIPYNEQINLEKFISEIDETKYNGFILLGYADYLGNEDDNKILSEKRVNKVYNFILNRGISKNFILKTIGKGELTGIPENEIGNSKNRRVDIKYTKIENTPIKKETVKKLPLNFENAEIGSTIALKNLNFIGGSHRLIKTSMPTLDSLLLIMENNETLKIEIQGHICCQDKGKGDGFDFDTQTNDLSVQRAKFIYDFLVENGIAKDRLSYKGFGANKRIIVPEISESDKTINRRVEIKIIDK